MPISMQKYVDITSGVGGSGGVRQKDLIGRIFSTNERISPDVVLEFTDIADIASFFGTDSNEYKRAVFYSGWISKQTKKAKKISYARYAPSGAVPILWGGGAVKNLASFTAITAGALTITVTDTTTGNIVSTDNLTGIDLSSASSLADVASLVTTSLASSISDVLKTGTVTYQPTTREFILRTTSNDPVRISVDPSQLAALLNWTTGTNAISTSGEDEQSPIDAVISSTQRSTNFGSFLFNTALTLDEHEEIGVWNKAQNVRYLYTVATDRENYQEWCERLLPIGGTTVTEVYPGEYLEMAPMIQAAATDYNSQNAVSNYMFQTFDVTPTVTDTTTSNQLDAVRCNYYGLTETAGQVISFYQRGVMMGGATDPLDQSIYVNEIWLKDLCGSQIMSLQMALPIIGADREGVSQVTNILLAAVELALYNGVIAVGKPLNAVQKEYITSRTGDDRAWLQVQNIGWWLKVNIEQYTTTDGRTEYKITYLLMYSKRDSVRFVEGAHTLI